MKRSFKILLLLLAFTRMSAVCCDLWNVDIPALEAKTKEVLTSNGIEPPAFIFALGDSLNDYCIFKESKRECLQYFIQSADKDSIKIFRQKKDKKLKRRYKLLSYAKDATYITYLTYLSPQKPRIPIVFLYYNERASFSGICVDCRVGLELLGPQGEVSKRFNIGAITYLIIREGYIPK